MAGPPKSAILPIKRKLMEHIKANTDVIEVGENVNFTHNRLPYAWLQIGPALTNEDINGTKDEIHEFGVRVVASDEDECWRCIEQIRLLWYDELHQLGVLNISNVSTNPGFQFSNNQSQTCDVLFRIVIRYYY
jgi:hypothetical protein